MAYLPSDWAGALDSGIVKTPFKNKRWPCMTLWKYVTVDVQGNVIVCCRDYESSSRLGNILKEDYRKITQKIKALQKRHLKGDYNYSVCAKCNNSFDSSLDWWE
jgi:radical SAM protein with 4Fe4S-binding SPASM domain